MKISVFENVYEPSEDSFLLLKMINGRYSLGVDLGSGTGIIGLYGLGKGFVNRVVFVDLNPYAVYNTFHNLYMNGLLHRGLVVRSPLPSPLNNDFFDVVFANPPYLPGVPSDYYEHSLLGGVEGYESVLLFIDEAYRLLKHGGILYIVFSSLSGEETVFKHIVEKGFKVENVYREHYFFEDIIGVEAVKS